MRIKPRPRQPKTSTIQAHTKILAQTWNKPTMPSVTPTTANRGQQAAPSAPTTSTHGQQHRMTQTQTVSHIATVQRARYRKSRPMNAPGRISALAVAILATALSVLALNCQGNPEPTPTTVPTIAPTATEAYVPPTLTPDPHSNIRTNSDTDSPARGDCNAHIHPNNCTRRSGHRPNQRHG